MLLRSLLTATLKDANEILFTVRMRAGVCLGHAWSLV